MVEKLREETSGLRQESELSRRKVKEVMGWLTDEPEEDLKVAFEEFLAITSRGEGVNQIGRANLEEIEERCAQEDYFGALLAMAKNVNLGPVAGGQKRAIRALTKEVQATLPRRRQDRVVAKQPPPEVFGMGWGAHFLVEDLVKFGGDFSQLNKLAVDLEIEEGRVVGVEFRERQAPPLPLQRSFQDLMAGEAEVGGEVLTEGEGVSFRVGFEEVLPAPDEGQSLVDWTLAIFENSLGLIRDEMGSFPNKPYEVAEILKQAAPRRALIQALEAAHILFGPRRGLSLVRGGMIGRTLEEFRILNLFSLVRVCLDLARAKREEGEGLVRRGPGVLMELPVGDLKIRVAGGEGQEFDFDMKGGTVDLVEVRWASETGELVIDPGKSTEEVVWDSLEWPRLVQYAEHEFRSQRNRYRRALRGEDGRLLRNESGQVIETRTALGRNLRSLEKIAFRRFGRDTFNRQEIIVVDEKFFSGDADRWTVLNVDDLPLQEHEDQAARYIFWVIAQLCWVDRWSQGAGEDFALTIEEIVGFAEETGILKRAGVRAEIRYELTDGRVVRSVVVRDKEELKNLAEQVVGARHQLLDDESRLRILRASKQLTAHRKEHVKVITQEPKPLPGPLGGLCDTRHGRHYLIIENLASQLGLGVEREKRLAIEEEGPVVERAIFFEKEKVFVFWVRGLLGGEEVLRIGVDQRTNLAISGLPEGLVTGSLANRELVGVKRRPEELMASFLETVWKRLESKGTRPASVPSVMTEEGMICPDGEVRKPIKGKSIVLSYNVLKGIWSVDGELLREAVESIEGQRDTFGVRDLAELMNTRPPEPVNFLCPMFYHPNLRRESPAAAWYRDHIYCFVCKEAIAVRVQKRPFEIVPVAPGYGPEDYRPPSRERQRTFSAALEIGQMLNRHFPEARDYVASRFLDPDQDLGQFGYFPYDFGKCLGEIVACQSFRALVKEAGGRLSLDHIEGYQSFVADFEDGEVLLAATQELLDFVGQLPSADQIELKEMLNLRRIREMGNRGIIGKTKEGWHRGAGRLLLQTFWPDQTREDCPLVPANLTTRGITRGRTALYKGKPYGKGFLRQSRKTVEREGRTIRLQATPVGVWFPDRDAFLTQVSTRKEVAVWEGAFNHGSFARMRPDLKDMCFTMSGTGYRQLIAFLRWLGVAGDRFSQGLNLGIEGLWVGYDWDWGGATDFERNTRELKMAFPSLEILPVTPLLPPEVQAIVPGHDPKLFQEGGPYYNKKLDLNDVLRRPGIREKYGYHPPR